MSIGKTYKKGKSIGEKRLSNMGAFCHVDVPGGHRSAEQRDMNNAHKTMDMHDTQEGYADRDEMRARMGM